MSIRRSLAALKRPITGAFHEYVRAVFAEHSVRARFLRTNRARWLQSLAGLKSGVRLGIRLR